MDLTRDLFCISDAICFATKRSNQLLGGSIPLLAGWVRYRYAVPHEKPSLRAHCLLLTYSPQPSLAVLSSQNHRASSASQGRAFSFSFQRSIASRSIRSPCGPSMRIAKWRDGRSYARSSASRLELCSEKNSIGGTTVTSRMKSLHLFGGRPFATLFPAHIQPRDCNMLSNNVGRDNG